MKLVNNSQNDYFYRINTREEYLLKIGQTLDVPEVVAKSFLLHKGVSVVEEVVTKKKTTKKEEK